MLRFSGFKGHSQIKKVYFCVGYSIKMHLFLSFFPGLLANPAWLAEVCIVSQINVVLDQDHLVFCYYPHNFLTHAHKWTTKHSEGSEKWILKLSEGLSLQVQTHFQFYLLLHFKHAYPMQDWKKCSFSTITLHYFKDILWVQYKFCSTNSICGIILINTYTQKKKKKHNNNFNSSLIFYFLNSNTVYGLG